MKYCADPTDDLLDSRKTAPVTSFAVSSASFPSAAHPVRKRRAQST